MFNISRVFNFRIVVSRFPSSYLLIILSFGVAGCDSQSQQDDFADRANRPPSGYTQTNADGQVVSIDEDDWNTAPVYIGVVRIDPAFPNPVVQGFVSIPVVVTQFNSVRGGLVLRSYNESGRLISLGGIPEARDPGAYVFNFSPSLIGRRGLVRLFIFDSGGEIVSYGDLLIEP